MMSFARQSRWMSRLAIILFVLQVSIPRGYMAADLDSGWYLKLCHQGLSAASMAVFVGEHHHHHHGDNADATDARLCDLAGLTFDGALSSVECENAADPVALRQLSSTAGIRLHGPSTPYHSRAPPATA